MAKRVEHKNKKTAEDAIAPRKATASPKKRTVPRPGREKFLPVSRADMDARGWDTCDFVYICGDAYVDHSSFGMAIISRILEAHAIAWVSSASQTGTTPKASRFLASRAWAFW